MQRFLRQTAVLESHFHFLSLTSSSHLLLQNCQMEADKKETQEKMLRCHYVRDGQTYRQVHTCKSHNGYRMNRQLGPTYTKQNKINFVWKSQVYNYLVHNWDLLLEIWNKYKGSYNLGQVLLYKNKKTSWKELRSSLWRSCLPRVREMLFRHSVGEVYVKNSKVPSNIS